MPEDSSETATESIKRMMPDFHRVEFPGNSSTLIATVVNNQYNNIELTNFTKKGSKSRTSISKQHLTGITNHKAYATLT